MNYSKNYRIKIKIEDLYTKRELRRLKRIFKNADYFCLLRYIRTEEIFYLERIEARLRKQRAEKLSTFGFFRRVLYFLGFLSLGGYRKKKHSTSKDFEFINTRDMDRKGVSFKDALKDFRDIDWKQFFKDAGDWRKIKEWVMTRDQKFLDDNLKYEAKLEMLKAKNKACYESYKLLHPDTWVSSNCGCDCLGDPTSMTIDIINHYLIFPTFAAIFIPLTIYCIYWDVIRGVPPTF